MTSAFSWQNSTSLFALLHSVLQGQICLLLQVFLDFLLLYSSPGAVAAWAQEGLEELSHIEGQEGQW